MGKKDDALVIPIEDTMRIIKEKTKKSPKSETEILGDADHGYIGYEDEVAQSVLNWIKGF